MPSLYDDPCGPMLTKDRHLRNLETQLEDARHDGDEEAVEELAEVIAEYKQWMNYCQERQWDWERQDARDPAYWEAMV